jgi:hypothetical protein
MKTRATLFFVLLAAVAAAQTTYVVTPLGGAFSSNTARGISSAGHVAGVSGGQPFVFRPSFPGSPTGVVHFLPTLPGGGSGDAYAVNAAGYVVGSSRNANGDSRPVLWGPDNALLGELPMQSVASGIGRWINDAGQIVGHHGLSINNITTGLWTTGLVGGSYGKPSGTDYSWGIRINEAGQMLVGVGDAVGEHLFLVTNGSYSQIPVPPNGWTAYGQDMNDFGKVVGNAPGAGAFYFDGLTSMRLENVPGWIQVTAGFGINNHGEIVGEGQRSSSLHRAVYWSSPASPGQELTNLIDASSPGYVNESDRGWNIRSATAINDRGQIAAVGTRTLSGGGGSNVPLLLTPVRGPATVGAGSYVISSGSYLSGSASSLASSDDNYLTVLTSHFATPISVQFEATSPSSTASAMSFRFEGHATASSTLQNLELFDFASGTWVLVDSRPATTVDSTVTVSPANPSRFIQPGTNLLRARMTTSSSARDQRSWQARIDLVSWTIAP